MTKSRMPLIYPVLIAAGAGIRNGDSGTGTRVHFRKAKLLILASFVFAATGVAAKDLTGQVQKQGGMGVTRIGRPDTAHLFGAAQQAGASGKVQTTDFNLNAQDATAAPIEVPSLDAGARSMTIKPLIEAAPNPPQVMRSGGGGEAGTPSTPSALPTTKQLIIVRLTYHMLDEQNLFKAAKMCLALRQTGCEVELMLDKEATRAANRHMHSQFMDLQERKFKTTHQALESVLSQGIRVVAAKDWASDFGVNEGNAVSGVEMMTTDQLAAEIVRSTKILEY